MKLVFTFLISGAFLQSCTYDIVRSGYKIDKHASKDCQVVIKKDTTIPDTVAAWLGEVKLDDGGFTTKCSEKDALDFLKHEACQLHADIVVITNEKRPDIMSSCYRCKGKFYRYKLTDKVNTLQTDKLYQEAELNERLDEDKRTRQRQIAGWAIGSLIATLLATLITSLL